jgi:hypothetical protein
LERQIEEEHRIEAQNAAGTLAGISSGEASLSPLPLGVTPIISTVPRLMRQEENLPEEIEQSVQIFNALSEKDKLAVYDEFCQFGIDPVKVVDKFGPLVVTKTRQEAMMEMLTGYGMDLFKDAANTGQAVDILGQNLSDEVLVQFISNQKLKSMAYGFTITLLRFMDEDAAFALQNIVQYVNTIGKIFTNFYFIM